MTAKRIRQPSILCMVKPKGEDITKITVCKVRVKPNLDLASMPLSLGLARRQKIDAINQWRGAARALCFSKGVTRTHDKNKAYWVLTRWNLKICTQKCVLQLYTTRIQWRCFSVLKVFGKSLIFWQVSFVWCLCLWSQWMVKSAW